MLFSMYVDIVKHVAASPPAVKCSVGDPERRQLKLKHAWSLVCASTDDGWPLTGTTNLICTVVDWLIVQCSPASVGFAQARPNYKIMQHKNNARNFRDQ